MQRIALFGGAFDPPHLGHVLCACYALQTANLDAVWVLPAANHPYGKSMQPFATRLALCQAAFAGLAAVSVRDDELRNPSGRTFDLLTMLSAAHTDVTWHLIGGTDTEQDLPKWYRGQDVLDMATVIPVPRRGYDDDHPAALPAISSTMVRERLANGATADDLLPLPVATMIAEQGLYLTAG